MKPQILLHIPKPCHENWDAMTPQDKGRHCNSCNKIVVDFSVMSDRQVLDYFKNATGNTCGRFHDDQLQRPLIEPQKQPSKWGYFLASFIAFIMSAKTFSQQKIGKVKFVGKPSVERVLLKGDIIKIKKDTNKIKTLGDTIISKDVVVQVPYGQVKKTAFTGSVATINATDIDKVKVTSVADILDGLVSGLVTPNLIQGKIIDEKNNVIVGATIKLKGTRLGTSSNSNGVFEIKSLGQQNKLTLTISSIGFETKEIEIVPKDLKGELSIILKESKNELGEVILIAPYGYSKGKYTIGGMSTVNYKKINTTIKDTVIKKVQQIFNKESIKIYPNPATKNSIIHIIIKDAGEYALHFFDTQSRLLTVKNIITNANNQTIEFPLPAIVSSGNYFIRILNEKTKKQVTEKIIVQ